MIFQPGTMTPRENRNHVDSNFPLGLGFVKTEYGGQGNAKENDDRCAGLGFCGVAGSSGAGECGGCSWHRRGAAVRPYGYVGVAPAPYVAAPAPYVAVAPGYVYPYASPYVGGAVVVGGRWYPGPYAYPYREYAVRRGYGWRR